MSEKPIAHELAKKQKQVSVAEFFEKNRHLLGYANKAQALLTSVKELVDNSLDAAEEANTLPEIKITLSEVDKEKYRLVVEDNGPGIVKQQIPQVFGRFLYGSKFGANKQSLTGDQQIMLLRDGKVTFECIGDFCDEFMHGNSEQVVPISADIKAPCFSRETKKISWKPVTHVIRHKNENKTFKIKTEHGRSVTVTGNHSLFSIDSESMSVVEVAAQDLKAGEFILAPSHLPEVLQENPVKEINILQYVNPSDIKNNRIFVYGVDESIFTEILKSKKIKRKVNPDSKRERRFYQYNGMNILEDSMHLNYVKNRYLPLRLALQLGLRDELSNCKIRTYQTGTGKPTEIPVTWRINNDLMTFLGLYVAEGHSDIRQVGFTFGQHETELVQEIKRIAKSYFNTSVTLEPRPEKSAVRLKVFGWPFSYLLRRWCGKGAKNKRVPEFIFRIDAEARQQFLDAIHRGDGSFVRSQNRLDYSTVSSRLSNEIIHLWSMQGVLASHYVKVTEKNIVGKRSTSHVISIYGSDLEKSKFYTGKASKLLPRYQRLPAYLFSQMKLRNFNNRRLYEYPSAERILTRIGLGKNPYFAGQYLSRIDDIECREYRMDHFTHSLIDNELADMSESEVRLTCKGRQLINNVNKLVELSKSDLCLLKVRNVEEVDSPQYVYDISVPGDGSDENFIAGNSGAICVRNSRGQQGIGVSSVVLYSQLTTGKPAIITSKIDPNEPAHKITMHLDVKKNEPEIVSSEEVEWNVDHGTKVEFVLEGKYIDTKQSVPEYIKQTAIVNPHARIIFINPNGQKIEYPRVTEVLPKKSKAVKPHPHGTELGILKRMLTATSSRSVKSFLINEFDKVGSGSADEILKIANIDPKIMPKLLTPEQMEALLKGMQEAKIQNPSTDCLSPIGAEILKKSLESEYDLEFAHAITRSPAVYRGISFEVEVGIGYGGELDKEGRIALGRFANRVPLLYQEGACAVAKAVKEVNWKSYGLQQSGDNLPQGPAIVIVHIASVWVPFTSEGKEAVASYPEIIKEIKLAVQECGRRLQLFVSRKQKSAIEARKREIFKNYSHELAASLAKITGKNEEKIKENLLKIAESMYTASDEEGEEVEIEEERKSTSDEESEEVEE